jgi:hypothetical protein
MMPDELQQSFIHACNLKPDEALIQVQILKIAAEKSEMSV